MDEKLAEKNPKNETPLLSIFIPRYLQLKFKLYVQLYKSIKSIDYTIFLCLLPCIINMLLVYCMA